MATEDPADLIQDDTFFACSNGRLKLREFADGRGELIHYARNDEAGPNLSDYLITPVADPKVLRETLSRALGIRGRVRKRRRVYLFGRTRIHLDEVDGLGSFVELEVVLDDGETPDAGQQEATRLMERLGIPRAQLVEGAYLDLMAKGQRP